MITIWDTQIPQLTGDQVRRTYIYLPDSYEQEEDHYYPVLYMFDGHNIFYDSHATYGKSWGMKEFMDCSKTEIIIVAVECNHDPDHGRLKEYSPYSFLASDVGNLPGKGHIYMDWLVHELKPAVDSHYRTLADRKHTMIAGSSMGGLMSLYAVTNYNDTFSRAACLSPSLWFNRSGLNRMLSRSVMAEDTIIYMDYGSREMGNHPNMRPQFARVTYELISMGVMVESRIIPNGEHTEASWEGQIPFFMKTLLYDLVEEEDLPSHKITDSTHKSTKTEAISQKMKEDAGQVKHTKRNQRRRKRH